MTVYAAIVNTPGYLPFADEPALFLTAREAWQYLVSEVDRSWDDYPDDENGACLEAHTAMHVQNQDEVGTVYASTPGYDGDQDLGIAYSVAIAVEAYSDSLGNVWQSADEALEEFLANLPDLSDEETESVFQFTSRDADARTNLAAIAYGVTYSGLDSRFSGDNYPVPTPSVEA